MKEINLAKALTAKRREKGITQDELAAYIGVSKASVSKWETGVSYPDIVHLPVLASYFDISIDSLMDYSPQLSKPEIQKTYARLALDFAEKPCGEVLAECETLIKKYYSCYPFLVEMAQLYVNHAITEEASKEQMLQRAIKLCRRVILECHDVNTTRTAAVFQSVCHIAANEPAKVLDLMGEELPPNLAGNGMLIAQAHQMLGAAEKAKSVMQTDLYMALAALLEGLSAYMQMCLQNGDMAAAETAFRRAEGLSELFEMRQLNPNAAAAMYIMGAHIYAMPGAWESQKRTLEMLCKYVEICTNGFFPVALRGDGFFNSIDGWLDQNAGSVPRDAKLVKRDMLEILADPSFDSLRENPEFTKLENKMKKFTGGE